MGVAALPLRARSLSPRVNGSEDSTICACSRQVRRSKRRTSVRSQHRACHVGAGRCQQPVLLCLGVLASPTAHAPGIL